MSSATKLTPFTLNDGHQLPAIGLGTAGMRGEAGVQTLVAALRGGYRLLDSAVVYCNEREVGEALRRSGVAREEVRLSSKIPIVDHGYEQALRSVASSCERLGVQQIDLHLIHWPCPWVDKYVDTWRGLVAAQAEGLVCSIGVSNFTPKYLEQIIDATGVVPAVNQIELHPHFPQREQRDLDRRLGICTQAWSPLGHGAELFASEPVAGAAQRLGVTAAQVVLRWAHQLGTLPVPRSTSPHRQRQNLDLGGFQLTNSEMTAISSLGGPSGRLWNADPDTVCH